MRKYVKLNESFSVTVDTHFIVWDRMKKKAVAEFDNKEAAVSYFKSRTTSNRESGGTTNNKCSPK